MAKPSLSSAKKTVTTTALFVQSMVLDGEPLRLEGIRIDTEEETNIRSSRAIPDDDIDLNLLGRTSTDAPSIENRCLFDFTSRKTIGLSSKSWKGILWVSDWSQLAGRSK